MYILPRPATTEQRVFLRPIERMFSESIISFFVLHELVYSLGIRHAWIFELEQLVRNSIVDLRHRSWILLGVESSQCSES